MSDAGQAALIIVVGAIVTIVTLVLTNRAKHRAVTQIHEQRLVDEEARRAEKESDKVARLAEKESDRQADIEKEQRDYARQDLVADRLEQATRLTMAKLNKVEEIVDVTHALVNSDKTANMKAKRDDKIITLALMHEVVSLKKAASHQPNEESLRAIDALVAEINTLESDIEERLSQQLAAEQRVALDQAAAGAASDAADRQITAAHAQQDAANSQQKVADQISSALGEQREVADQITEALDQSTPPQ